MAGLEPGWGNGWQPGGRPNVKTHSDEGRFGVILGLYWGYIRVILGLYWGYIRVILGLYWVILGWTG